jgi:hypothetical protein
MESNMLFINNGISFWQLRPDVDTDIMFEAINQLGSYTPAEMYDFWLMMMGA